MSRYTFIIVQLCLFLAGTSHLHAQHDGFDFSKKLKFDLDKTIYFRYERPDSARYYAVKGIKEAKKGHNRRGEAVMLNQLGMITDNQGDYSASTLSYLKAFNIYRDLRLRDGMATELIRLGVVEMRKGHFDKATANYLQALKLSEEIADRRGIMEANLTLGEVSLAQKQYGQALKYMLFARQISRNIPFSSLSLNILNNLGLIYTATGDFSQAKACFSDGINQSKQPRYQGLYITLTTNLAAVYAKEGNYPVCIRLQQSALLKARQIHNFLRELQVLNSLAGTYSQQNVDSSLVYYEKARQLARSKRAYRQEIDALEQDIRGLLERAGKFPAALKAKKEASQMSERLYYQEMSRQVANLQVQHELLKSEARVLGTRVTKCETPA